MATVVRDRTFGPSARKPARLCGVTIEEPGMAMVLELYRRTAAGRATEACDLIGGRRGSAVEAQRSLDFLIHERLVVVTSAGRRFRRLELSSLAFAEMKERFATLV